MSGSAEHAIAAPECPTGEAIHAIGIQVPIVDQLADDDAGERASKRPRIGECPSDKEHDVQVEPFSDGVRSPQLSTDNDMPLQMTMLAAPTTAAICGLDPPAAASTKKNFPCRTCGALLSSASNRSRHERTSHGTQKKPPTKFVTIPAIPTLPSRVRKRTTAGTAAAPQYVAAHPISNNIEMLDGSEESDDYVHEPEDVELLQYLTATGTLGRTTSEGEEAKASSSDEDRAGSSSSMDPTDQSSAASTDSELIPGMPILVSEAELQSGCFAFLQWLANPPMTPCEALVKAKRVKSITQLHPIKCNLRFLFTLLNTKGFAHGKVDLSILTRLDVCQAVFDVLNQRGVGSSRYHAVFLLCKKSLTFLSTQESQKKKQFLPPSIYDSYMYINGVCSDSGQQRKQEAQNRALLGVHASQQLQKQQQQQSGSGRPFPFAVPSQWSSPSGSEVLDLHHTPMDLRPSVAATLVSANVAVASSPNELSKMELKQVTQFCLVKLHECMMHIPVDDLPLQGARDRWFQSLLVTATLCMGLAPRSQVLKQMQIGSTFIKEAESGRYVIRLLADMCKNSKPTLVPLPLQLTPIFTHYLDIVRPRLLTPPADGSGEPVSPHAYVFFKRNRVAPRADYTACTSVVTLAALGKKINPHAFRSAVITMFHSEGASQAEIENLARVMSHDVAVARSHYYRPVFSEAAIETNDKMMRALLGDSCSPASLHT